MTDATAEVHIEREGRFTYIAYVSGGGDLSKLRAFTRGGAWRRSVRWAIVRGLRLVEAQ